MNLLGDLNPWRMNLWTRTNGRTLELYRYSEASSQIKGSVLAKISRDGSRTLRSTFYGPVPRVPGITEEESQSGIRYYVSEDTCDEKFTPTQFLADDNPVGWGSAAKALRMFADTEFSRWSRIYYEQMRELGEAEE